MQDHDLDALLGDAQEALLAKRGQDGYDDLRRVMDAIDARYPDDADARLNASNGALLLALGDGDLEAIAAAWAEARRRERAAMEALTGAIIWESERGAGPSEIARRAEVTRVTVNRALAH